MDGFLGNPKGTTEYYVCLATVIFNDFFRYERFIEVLEKIMVIRSRQIERQELETIFENQSFCIEKSNSYMVGLSEEIDWINAVNSIKNSAIEHDVMDILHKLTQSPRNPWLFQNSGRALGRLCKINPRSVISTINRLTNSRNKASRQAAAFAIIEAAEDSEHSQETVTYLINCTEILVADDGSEQARKFGRKAIEKLANFYTEKIIKKLHDWSQSTSDRLRLAASVLLQKEFVSSNIANQLLDNLQEDDSAMVKTTAKESKKIRNQRENDVQLVEIENEILEVWKIEDSSFPEQFYKLSEKISLNDFWNIVRRAIIVPLIQNDNVETFDDTITRISQCPFNYSTLLLKISASYKEMWKKSPEKICTFFTNWFIYEKGERRGEARAISMITQTLRNYGREYAIMLSDMLINIYLYDNRIHKNKVLRYLNDSIRGKISSPSQRRININRNLCIIIHRLYQEDREETIKLLKEWLRLDDLNGLRIAVSAITDLATYNDFDIIGTLNLVLAEDARSRAFYIFAYLERMIIDERDNKKRKIVIEALFSLLRNKLPEIRTGSANCLVNIERKGMGRNQESLIPFLVELFESKKNCIIPGVVFNNWPSVEIVQLLAEVYSNINDTKDIFELCNILDLVPHVDNQTRNAALAIMDYRLGTMERSKFSAVHYFRVIEDITEGLYGDHRKKKKLVKDFGDIIPNLKKEG